VALSASAERVRVASVRTLGGELRLYERADSFECDQFARGELWRRRVFFDDLLLVTLHRPRAWPFFVTCGGLAALGALPALFVLRQNPSVGLIPGLTLFAMLSLPFLVAIVARAVFGAHCVTLYGKRSRVRIPFGMRRGRAREAFERVRRRVAEAQALR